MKTKLELLSTIAEDASYEPDVVLETKTMGFDFVSALKSSVGEIDYQNNVFKGEGCPLPY